MAERRHIVHSIPPTYDERSRVLVLGSIPSPASHDAGFNYGHPRNRFWSVLAALAGEPVPSTNERKRDFCLRHHIALWDVVAECDMEGASDASIVNVRANPLTRITAAAPIEAVFCTGGKAHALYRRHCQEQVGMPATRLPSTSPANAACGFESLMAAYAAIFDHEHPFEPPVLDVAQVVALEQDIASAGTPLSELMDRAGTALAWRVEGILRGLAGKPPAAPQLRGEGGACGDRGSGLPQTVVLCGNGNNGGDGWVAAARLAQAGWPVAVLAAKAPDELSAQPAHDAAVAALEALMALGGRTPAPGEDASIRPQAQDACGSAPLVLVRPSAEQVHRLASQADVVIDALLGTGASGRSPREPFATWIRAVMANAARCTVVAADVPSGISAQDGTAASTSMAADETVTMIAPKPGLAASACGKVTVAPLAYIEPFLQGIAPLRERGEMLR